MGSKMRADPRDHSKKLHVTYEGKTPDDYPGDSRDFLVGGWDYDRESSSGIQTVLMVAQDR